MRAAPRGVRISELSPHGSMDVTCERCGTEYDFDDALVSERGTTVKCTNCGAQFRVFRPAPAAGPERWVVRTLDGRELVFSALRELQAAISTGVVGRDDVLSRGGGRPRRLGSIAELDPFFKQAIVATVTSTAPGLGLPSARVPPPQAPPQRTEGSVAIPLPRMDTVPGTGSPRIHDEAPPKRSGTLRPPPPVLHAPHAQDRSEVRPAAGAARARGPADPMISTSVTGSMAPTSVAAAGHASRLQNLVAADLGEPITVPRNEAVAQSLAKDRTLPVPVGHPSHAHGAPPIVTSPVARAEPSHADESAHPHPHEEHAHADPQIDGSTARLPAPSEEASARARTPDESGVVEKRGAPASAPTAPAAEPTKPSRDVIEERRRIPAPITPSPGEVRVSYIPEPEPSAASPRFSTATPRRRGGSGRWIVGVVLLGATALLAATVGRKYLEAPAPTSASAPATDERVTKLVEEGDKSLSDGDLDGAKEKLDKASALAEKDPRAVLLLARLAVVRADQRWLKVRILPPGGAEATLAKSELGDAIEKMKPAIDAARSLLPNDPIVRRLRVDALRIQGERSSARSLVGEMPASGKTLEDELTLAALDLAEDKPSWPTVIERLRAASAADNNLGRARSMLVYALASSGDIAGAKAEHDRLASLSRPHPLTAALLIFMARMDTEQPATTGGDAASAAPPTTAATTAAPSNSTAATTAAGAATSARPPSQGGVPANGRVPDDYVAPNAGSVDVSDMHHRPPAQPTAPAAQPTTPPAQPTAPQGVDTSDLPGFGK